MSGSDFKKWLWMKTFLYAPYVIIIIQIACDLQFYLATLTVSHCSMKLTPHIVAVAFIEHKWADYSSINLKTTSAIT